MAGPRTDPPRGGDEKNAAEGAPAAAGAAPAWQAWLPLGAAVVLMPLLAFAITNFVLVPRMQKALLGAGAAEPVRAAEAKTEGHGEAKSHGGGHGGHGAEAEGGGAAAAGAKQTASLNKLLVNVAGTMASRYLLTSITLVGESSDLQGRVTQHEAQLKDMANGLLSTKTIPDLEKPGARNLLRGELLSGFNAILGDSIVQEVYFTEFAIQ